MTTEYGNPNSSEHLYGEEAALLVEVARHHVADLLRTASEAIQFTTGSTESIQLAVDHAVVSRRPNKPLRIAVSRVEHHAVLDAVLEYQRRGEAVIKWLPVDRHAQLDLDSVRSACLRGVDLMCVMAANNEVGTIYPVAEIAEMAADAGARTLIDATQAAGRIAIDLFEMPIDYVAISAHKMYGPKGVGALVTPDLRTVRASSSPTPGTGTGTPNTPAIVGLGEACRLRTIEMDADERRTAGLRDQLQAMLQASIPDLVVNGDPERRLPNNLHVAVPGVVSEAVLARLRHQVAISSGAACASGAQTHSHVLVAMGLPETLREGALRIGLGKFTSRAEVERASVHIAEAVESTRAALGPR